MNELFARMKKAHRADKEKPGVFGDYLDEFRGTWLKAISDAKIGHKFARSVANWAIMQDLLEVVQWFEKYLKPKWPRPDYTKFDNEFFRLALHHAAEKVIRWASDKSGFPSTWNFYSLQAGINNGAKSGKIGFLEWIDRGTVPAELWQGGLMAAARANQQRACDWLAARGAVIDNRIYAPLLEGGHVDSLRMLPDYPCADPTELLRTAAKAGQIPSLEWLRERLAPAFDPLVVIAEAVRHKHLHVLRWLREDCGVPAESFRHIRREWGDRRDQPSICVGIKARRLDIANWLQEVCQFAKADLAEPSGALAFAYHIGSPRDTKGLDWLQATFQFTTEEVRASGIMHSTDTNVAVLAINAPSEESFDRQWFVRNSVCVQWMLQTFDFTFEDLGVAFVARWAGSTNKDSLVVLQLAHERIPGGLPLADLSPEDAVTVAKAASPIYSSGPASESDALTWLHSAGLRTTDPRCAQRAIMRGRSGNLRVLHDLFGVTSVGAMPATGPYTYRLHEGMLEALHDCYGFTAADLRRIGWERVQLDDTGAVRVCLDKYGVPPREIWTYFLTRKRFYASRVTPLRRLLGMTAKDWRARNYQLFRSLIVWGGTCAEGRMDVLHKIFDVFELTAQDALALSRTPDIANTPRISLQRLAKKLKDLSHRRPVRSTRSARRA